VVNKKEKMMSDVPQSFEKRRHLSIPSQNVRTESFPSHGYGKSIRRPDHYSHGRELTERVIETVKVLEHTRDYAKVQHAIVKLSTPENVPIKNYRINFSNIGFDILSYSEKSESIATASILKNEINNLRSRIRQYSEMETHPGISYFSPLENIIEVPPEEKIDIKIDTRMDEDINVLVSFYKVFSSGERSAILNDLKSFVIDKNGSYISERTFSNDVTIVEIIILQSLLPELCKYYSTVRQVVRNNSVLTGQSIPISPIHNPMSIEEPNSEAIVAIVDSGINDQSPALQSLVAGRLQYLPNGSTESHQDHGTFVASRCIFGDSIESAISANSLTAQCKVYDIAIFGKKANGSIEYPNTMDLMIAIDDAVQRIHDSVKVFNLSIGANVTIAQSKYSDIAKLIDCLSRKYNVLFVISAGNILSLLGPYPQMHFLSPHSFITVGSVAKHSEPDCLAAIDEVSPFSRRGPGIDKGLKPEVVAHGGNMNSRFASTPRISTFGLSQDGQHIAYDVGTSHSAPLVAQYAAILLDAYKPQRVTLAKALLCHFTIDRGIPASLTLAPKDLVGLGEPDLSKALFESPNRVTYIHEGAIEINHYEYITFHVPNSLATGTSASLRICVTIVYDPPVNPDNDLEYSGARISAGILKPTNNGIVDVQPDDIRKSIVPWNPVIHFEKSFSRGYNVGAWQLRLRLFTRGRIPDDFKQSYSTIIEVIDESGGIPVYDDVLAQYGSIYHAMLVRDVA
jgi:hypothetical protein